MISSGSITQFFLFDVAHSIDLDAVQAALGTSASTATLAFKNAGGPRIGYRRAPIVADGAVVGRGEVDGFKVRVKLFDYGVISVMMTRPFAGAWSELTELSQRLIDTGSSERHATDVCHAVISMVRPALSGLRPTMLSEDYVVFAAHAFDAPQSAGTLLKNHGTEIAQVLRGERHQLSQQEIEEVLQHRLSYFADDLIVPAWNAAFVYDTPAGVEAAHEAVEFVNSQLLEFRYYDELLDGELKRTYAELQQHSWTDRIMGRRHTKATRRLHTLFIDVNELTDHLENSIKVVGDVYAARLVSLVAERVAVPDWKGNVREKLKTLDDIHRFAVEQTTASRATILETTVVLILIIELVLLLAGLR